MENGTPKIALIGHGKWGRNHARVLHQLGALHLVCDSSPEARAQVATLYPGCTVVDSVDEVVAASPDGIVLATPAPTHAPLSRSLLQQGFHVFCEKPLALSLKEARQVADSAAAHKRVLQVGHILEYHPVRRQVAEILAGGSLGRLLSARLVRTNCGTIRDAEDILQSFAPHDLAFALSLAPDMPESVQAEGFDLLGRNLADAAAVTLRYGGQSPLVIQIQVSWLEPRKEHRAILVGDKGMLVWNDTRGEASLTLYRTRIETPADGPPRVVQEAQEAIEPATGEPLSLELQDFLQAVSTGTTPRADAGQGVAVAALLDACQRSISQQRRVQVAGDDADAYIHPTAEVHPTATVGEGARVWHHCHVMHSTRIGRNVALGQNCFVAANVHIGDGARIQNNVSVYEGVRLDEDVFIGPSAVFTNVRFPRAFVSRKREYEETRVGRGATIGANSTVVCGVTIGAYAFVAAGAVVTKDIPPHTLVEGVPAVPSGFMCRCGERLRFRGAEETGCTRCSRRYRRAGQSVEEVN